MPEETTTAPETDYSLANPDTITKYKSAGQISQKVLETVSGWCLEGSKIVEICQKGDALLDEEIAKVYKHLKLRGIGHPTTISPSSYITPYTPLVSDAEEAARTLKSGEAVKIQLGAQIDGFGTIVCNTIIVGGPVEESKDRSADLLLATYYCNELLLRLIVPPGLLTAGTDEEKQKATTQKPYTQTQITQFLDKICKSYECNLVENTTSWMFERNDIEGKKKIITAPGEGSKGDGMPEVGEAWGMEVGVSLGSGKVKTISDRVTLHRRTNTTYALARQTSRAILTEIVKKFKTFPFSLRQLEDERAAKVGLLECVRNGLVRQYEVAGDKDGEPVSRLFTTIALTKHGVTKLAAPPALDLEKYTSDKKITDEEILKILELPINKPTHNKPKNKKKKKAAGDKVEAKDAENESSAE